MAYELSALPYEKDALEPGELGLRGRKLCQLIQTTAFAITANVLCSDVR